MNFQDFLKFVPNIISIDLPGEAAHYKMAPLDRIKALKESALLQLEPRVAAVMILLYPKNEETYLVLIERNNYKGVHSSQIAFPGGKFELTDSSFQVTALRETTEEIGIPAESINVIKDFTPIYIPPSNFKVYPFVGIAKHPLDFIKDQREVASILEVPLTELLNDHSVNEVSLQTSYSKEALVPAFTFMDHQVWGATAMILNEFKQVMLKATQYCDKL